ncbi:MAG TPA: APC family permease [Pyrinomonadaceae bacterium]|nr:APC family permease [Pyrinomonadaceae bacterium]
MKEIINPEEKLVRGISRWDLTAIAVNTVIGTGIFILPAKVFGLIGSFSLLAFVVCALIVAFIVLCFAEVSSRFQATGGMYLYAKEAFGSAVGFEVGWLYWIVRVTTFATNCNALLLYIAYFFPSAVEGYGRILIVSAVVLVMTLVNFVGVRESAILTNIFTVGKIVPLLLFAFVGVFFIQPANFSFGATPEYGKFSEAILVLIYAFVGFEAAVIPAGETKEPQKAVPFALLLALVFCAVLFIFIQIVAIGTLPNLAESKTPLADAAQNFLGSFGATFIAIGALVSVLGNLNGGFLAASRIPFAMAEQKELPQILAKTHAKFKTPFVSLFATALVILVFTLQTSFYSALTIATITRLLVYATTCAALPVFRRKENVPSAKFIAPFGILASILSLVLIIWLLTNVDFTKEGKAIIYSVVIGLLLYFAYKIFGKKRTETRSDKGE